MNLCESAKAMSANFTSALVLCAWQHSCMQQKRIFHSLDKLLVTGSHSLGVWINLLHDNILVVRFVRGIFIN